MTSLAFVLIPMILRWEDMKLMVARNIGRFSPAPSFIVSERTCMSAEIRGATPMHHEGNGGKQVNDVLETAVE